MIDEILATRAEGRLTVALREEGRLMELAFDSAEAPGAVGDIVLGRVTAVMKGMEACFVDIGAERAGFLSLAARGEADAMAALPALHEGAPVMVQVTKSAQEGKGAGLTRNVSIAGRYLVLTPYQPRIAISHRIADEHTRAGLENILLDMVEADEGFIVRTAAEGVPPAALQQDAERLRALWLEISDSLGNAEPPARLYCAAAGLAGVLRDRAHDAVRRVVVDDARDEAAARDFAAEYLPVLEGRIERWSEGEPLFEALGVAEEIEAALEPQVPLPCGGTLIIESTHAVNTVDVNTGRNTGRSGHAATVRATNLEAAAEIARQLRLRGLGGLTVIDFIHMDDAEAEDEVLDALLDALEQDPAFIRATGFSDLGLVELARRRGAGPLAEHLRGEAGGGERDDDDLDAGE